ncbi:MAG: DUF1890 domain-containing protein [Methanobacteriaceae archaeon]|jgi:hypothetical protein|nr:DUF1890 domain-containing protein [Methanobacteriaceae archaeon]
MKKALVLLGCPEAPSQTPLAIYATYKLNSLGFDVTITANPAASKLLKISDPENKYISNIVDLDRCLNELNEGEFDLLLGFIHKEAAASFFVTFYQILQIKSIAIVFEKDEDLVEEYANIISDSTDAEVLAVKAFHNPNPVKVKLDKALEKI